MDPVKAVATIEGKDVEVELKAPPGYIAESEFATRFQDKLEKRVERITKNRREELVNDEEFVQSIFTSERSTRSQARRQEGRRRAHG